MIRILSILTVMLMPAVTFAQSVDLSYFEDAISALGNLIELLIPIVIALGLLVFIWGMVQFILAAGDDEGNRKQAAD